MSEATKMLKGGSFLLSMPDPEQVFTPEDLSEEQRMIAGTAREFSEKVRARLHEIEQDKPFHSRPLLQELGELGLLGLEIPEKYGGMGLDKVTATVAVEEYSRAGAFAITIGAHTGIGTLPIVYFGTPEQKAKYLPKLATGEWVAAYALTEPNAGSDALGARTTARLSEDGKYWILNGTKQWITNAGFADVFVVYAKVDGEKFSAFIVERSFPGVSIGPEEKKMGLHASSTCSLILEDAKVPVENLLGEIGKGHHIAFNILNIGRWKLGAGAVGSAKLVLSIAAEYAKTRNQFGKPIAELRAIQQKLADMAVRTYVTESMGYRTAGLLESALEGLDPDAPGSEVAKRLEEYAMECSIMKVFGSEAFDFVADEGVQIHGGYGFMDEYEVSTAYRDSRINRIFEGTNEINRLLIPGTLVRRAMKGQLPIMQALAGLQGELMELTPFEESDEPLAQEVFMIDRAKKVFLMLAGLGVQKFQMALEKEQELLLGVADIAIEIYAMESAVLRALKAIRAGRPGLKPEMARVYCQEAFERIATIARTLLPAVEEDGDTLRTQLSMLKRLTRYTPTNTIALKRQIAARVLEKGDYVC
ncbi:alkylation response protein AidB-like acyl-CoA dehydrogenase [Symbiobacterium terraclitae]|uniref:Alkylation response protein AidB-like acyl-CoA dehydrogenase n=1 Tax=Symbiobacterium terraclitae TaxID=557451 RepID=A0ABS4JPT7_9FIRM|nr:acyl-CoA dehydrogenase family protein [Symbiobacterium terraclitae]MBP2016986.1 alkylation response protein AidB-like acyl-CoA dehydrogenase [Symbiobacterium terraclitae]